MVNYVVGFAFNEAKTHVVLIEKQRPEWQKGKLNGIGGKVEKDESIIRAMEREFLEETGLPILKSQWERFVKIGDTNHIGDTVVHFYRAFIDKDRIHEVKSNTDEAVFVMEVFNLYKSDTIQNLSWLIPLALDDSSASDDIFFFPRLK